MQALVAGQIDLIFDQLSSSLPQLYAGAIRSYAVMAQSRAAAAPDIPTVDEAGLPQFYLPVWHGMWVPKGTPKDIIGKLNGAVVESLAVPPCANDSPDIGQEIYPRQHQTPEALGAYHKVEIERVVADRQGGGNQGRVNASTSRCDGGATSLRIASKTAGRRMATSDRVLIAGAGPVGLVAAANLVRHGVPVTIFEGGPDLSMDSARPRSIHRRSTCCPT